MSAYYRLPLKIRKNKGLRLSIEAEFLIGLVRGDETMVDRAEQMAEAIERSNQVDVHDKLHLSAIVNNVKKGTKLNELQALMKVSRALANIPDDEEKTIKLSKYVVDLIVDQLKSMEINRLSAPFSEFMLEFLDVCEVAIEMDKGQDDTFEIE